jgi:hypothetical protein
MLAQPDQRFHTFCSTQGWSDGSSVDMRLPRLFSAVLSISLVDASGQFSITLPPNSAVLDPVAVQVMETPLKRALEAYNAGDLRALRAEFASGAPGLGSEQAARSLFLAHYRSEFGKFRSRQLLPHESVADKDWGVLVYEARFENAPNVRLSANFVRETGLLKLAQIRIEKPEAEE